MQFIYYLEFSDKESTNDVTGETATSENSIEIGWMNMLSVVKPSSPTNSEHLWPL